MSMPKYNVRFWQHVVAEYQLGNAKRNSPPFLQHPICASHRRGMETVNLVVQGFDFLPVFLITYMIGLWSTAANEKRPTKECKCTGWSYHMYISICVYKCICVHMDVFAYYIHIYIYTHTDSDVYIANKWIHYIYTYVNAVLGVFALAESLNVVRWQFPLVTTAGKPPVADWCSLRERIEEQDPTTGPNELRYSTDRTRCESLAWMAAEDASSPGKAPRVLASEVGTD